MEVLQLDAGRSEPAADNQRVADWTLPLPEQYSVAEKRNSLEGYQRLPAVSDITLRLYCLRC
jgi:hypothetical protein